MLELRPDTPHDERRVRNEVEAFGLLDELLETDGVRSVYQPIVELGSSRVVGYEALARGPRGTMLETPDALFATARSASRVVDLCMSCRAAALDGAATGGLGAPFTLFVNVEPEAVDVPLKAFPEAPRGGEVPHVVAEITERALALRPAEMLRGVDWLRDLGWGIALDDVGADRNSLALMPFLRPDVVKLDLGLVQARPNRDVAEIVTAVNAECERSGATVLAEGIETEKHAETALAMGATLGQGWLFGRPGTLPPHLPAGATTVKTTPRPRPDRESTPVRVVERVRSLRRATKAHLVSISRHLEEQALGLGEATVVLGGFQKRERFSPSIRRRYAELARRAAFVGVFGIGMGESPAPGVRGAPIELDDPFVDEWDLAVLSPYFAALLAARDLGDEGPEADRRFDFAVTYDRQLVVEAASALMARVAPAAGAR